MRKSVLLAAAIAMVAAPAASFAKDKDAAKPAADKAGAKAAATPGATPEDIQRGVIIVRSFSGALNSDKVTKEQKGAIIACLYNNPVRRLSVATGEVIAKNDKLDGKNPAHVYGVAAAICKVPRNVPDAAGGDGGR